MLSNEARAIKLALQAVESALNGADFSETVRICGGHDYDSAREVVNEIIALAVHIRDHGAGGGGAGASSSPNPFVLEGYSWIDPITSGGWQEGDLITAPPGNGFDSAFSMGLLSGGSEGGVFGTANGDPVYGLGANQINNTVINGDGSFNSQSAEILCLAKPCVIKESENSFYNVIAFDPAVILSFYGAETATTGKGYVFTGFASEQINAGNKQWGIWRKA